MISVFRITIAIISSLALSGVVHALQPSNRVDNFRLLDQTGASHELHYLSDAKAIELMVHGIGCPIVRQSLPALAAARKQFASQGVEQSSAEI